MKYCCYYLTGTDRTELVVQECRKEWQCTVDKDDKKDTNLAGN